MFPHDAALGNCVCFAAERKARAIIDELPSRLSWAWIALSIWLTSRTLVAGTVVGQRFGHASLDEIGRGVHSGGAPSRISTGRRYGPTIHSSGS